MKWHKPWLIVRSDDNCVTIKRQHDEDCSIIYDNCKEFIVEFNGSSYKFGTINGKLIIDLMSIDAEFDTTNKNKPSLILTRRKKKEEHDHLPGNMGL